MKKNSIMLRMIFRKIRMNLGIVVDVASWCRCVRRAASACKEAEAARKQMGQEWGKVCLSLTRRFQQVL